MIHRVSGLVMPENSKDCRDITCDVCALRFESPLNVHNLRTDTIKIEMIMCCVLVEAELREEAV